MKNLHAFTSHRDDSRRYIAIYRVRGNDLQRIETKLEVARRRKAGPHGSPGFRLHLGNRGSETPLDAHIDLGLVAAYWELAAPGLGRLCEWLGRGHKRDLSLRVHHGALWWKVWFDDDDGYDNHHRCDKWQQPKLWPWSRGRRKYRSWMCLRDGSLDLNPVDALFGNKLWLKDETFPGATARALVPVGDFPGDEYEVDFTLERRTVRRKHGPAWARRIKRVDYEADAECRPGIPVRNHDWKGDEILGWGVKVSEQSAQDGTWVREAVAGTIEQVRRDRAHYGYRPSSPAAQE